MSASQTPETHEATPTGGLNRRRLFAGAGAAGAGALGMIAATSGSAQADSSRLSTVLLTSPLRVFDSRTDPAGKVAAGTVRTITLPASLAPNQGILCNVTASKGEKPGFATVYAGGVGRPGTSTVNFNKKFDVANFAIVATNANTISVYAEKTVHIIIDVTGVLRDIPGIA